MVAVGHTSNIYSIVFKHKYIRSDTSLQGKTIALKCNQKEKLTDENPKLKGLLNWNKVYIK